MLIYQISALLDNGEGSSKTNMKAAEIHIPFLLKVGGSRTPIVSDCIIPTWLNPRSSHACHVGS